MQDKRTREQAAKILGNDEDSLHPDDEQLTEEEFWEEVDKIVGMTREEAAKHMWPDEPAEQLAIINEVLGGQE